MRDRAGESHFHEAMAAKLLGTFTAGRSTIYATVARPTSPRTGPGCGTAQLGNIWIVGWTSALWARGTGFHGLLRLAAVSSWDCSWLGEEGGKVA